jgi:hypothetical protein
MAAGESKTDGNTDGSRNGKTGGENTRPQPLSRTLATQGSPRRFHRCHGRSTPYVEGYDYEESIQALTG